MMPRKKMGNQREAETSSLENSSITELDNKALKVKNAHLVQEHAKLLAERAQWKLEKTQLQEDLFKQNSSFLNLKNILSSIDVSIKTAIPKFLEITGELTKISQLCAIGKEVSLAKDTMTLAVQPHTVNGHVLQHPTISLSRLNNITNRMPPGQRSNQNSETDSIANAANQNVASDESQERLVANEDTDQNVYDVERIIYRRRRNIPIEIEALEQEDEMVSEHDINEDGDYSCSRLVTIREEDEDVSTSSPISRRVSREVKIYIDRLPSDFVRRNVRNICSRSRDSNSLELTSSTDSTGRKSYPTHNDSPRNSSVRPKKSTIKVVCTDENGTTSFLNNDSGSKATVIQETVYRRSMPPLKRREARYFGEPSSFLQSSNGSTVTSLSVSTLQEDNLEMSDNLSAIQNVPSCSVSNVDVNMTDNPVRGNKLVLLENLGLSPAHGLATSTPMRLSNVQQEDYDGSKDGTSNNRTPVKNKKVAKVNMKRGGSNNVNKIARVVLRRMTLENNSSNSANSNAVQKMADILSVPVKTRSSQLRQSLRKKTNPTDVSNSSSSSNETIRKSDSKENVRTSRKRTSFKENSVNFTIDDSTPKYTRKKTVPLNSPSSSSSTYSGNTSSEDQKESPKKRVVRAPIENKTQVPTKSKAVHQRITVLKRVSKSPIRFVRQAQFRQSPRPKRAARPGSLKEPTLNKKMRRSK